MKIRGFRVELGEIDTHLSKHPLIRENVTLVRRDKDEEKSLISYIVPEMKAWSSWLKKRGLEDELETEGMTSLLKRFRPLRDDAREYLKTKLPAYSIPSTIIPLRKMPLNPNGKIDKPALPFPDVSELSAAALKNASTPSSAMSKTEKSLTLIWASLLRIDAETIGIDDSFFDLGGDSIKGNRMVFEVRKTWRVEISMNVIFRSPTLKDFATSIDRLRDPDAFEPGIDSQVATNDAQNDSTQPDEDYAADALKLTDSLSNNFPSAMALDLSRPATVFLTGATGFLGAYIIRDLLSRKLPLNLVAHVRGKTQEAAMLRVQETCKVGHLAFSFIYTDNACSRRMESGIQYGLNEFDA